MKIGITNLFSLVRIKGGQNLLAEHVRLRALFSDRHRRRIKRKIFIAIRIPIDRVKEYCKTEVNVISSLLINFYYYF